MKTFSPSTVGNCLYNSCSLFITGEKSLHTAKSSYFSRVLSAFIFLSFSSHLVSHVENFEAIQNIKCLNHATRSSLYNSSSLYLPIEEQVATLLGALTSEDLYLQ